MTEKVRHHTFGRVIKDIAAIGEADLSAWLKTIEKYYLTEHDRVALRAMRAKYSQDPDDAGAPQRVLGVQFAVSQWLLSRRIQATRAKVFKVYSFLRDPGIISAYKLAQRHVTPRQYELLGLVLAGNRLLRISTIWGVDKASVTITFKAMLKSLEANSQLLPLHQFALYTGKQMWLRDKDVAG